MLRVSLKHLVVPVCQIIEEVAVSLDALQIPLKQRLGLGLLVIFVVV